LKHDCPWCGISLKWRYVPSKPLPEQQELVPLYATPVCPECEERLSLCRPEHKNQILWRRWGFGLIFVIWLIWVWTRIKVFAYINAGLYIVLTVTTYITRSKCDERGNVRQKYCKYDGPGESSGSAMLNLE